MTEQSTRIVTGEVRFSYVNLLKPRENQYGGEPKYSVTLLIPKSDVATKQKIDAAIQAAIEKGKNGPWNGVVPPNVAIPIHDGDGVKQDGTPYGEECKGHWVMTASSGVDYPPKIVDINLNPIIDATQIYSGMYGRIALNFAPYMFAGKKGIGCYISTNVQKTRDGEPLAGSAPDASEDFGGGFAQQPTQGFTQQPAQQPNPWVGTPMGNQPGVAPGYQQGYQQGYPQQFGQASQQQPQFDPITGMPINGAYGV